jgi:phosphoserine phosphatase
MLLNDQIDYPLCVDLDGTLIDADLLWESFIQLVGERPVSLLGLPVWLMKGRAHLKQQIARRVKLDVEWLPYRTDVLEFLKQEKEKGRRLVLVTAAEEQLARAVAEHLGFFDEVIASDGRVNLKGGAKLRIIEERFGASRFDYIGDSKADLPIWRSARKALLVQPGRRLLKEANQCCKPHRVFDRPDEAIASLIKILRPRQWAKNMLLAVPLIMGHQIGDPRKLLSASLAFIAFSLADSGVYVLDELADLVSDRKHPSKRDRPFAAGKVSIPVGIGASLLLLTVSAAVSLLLPPLFVGLLFAYIVLATTISLFLKRKFPQVNVFCLAGLYTHRILSGGAAISMVITPWLLAFSMSVFLGLATFARCAQGGPPGQGR